MGNADGTAIANATGNNPFVYSWNTTPVQTTNIATNLAVGNYSVTATDVNGCSASGSATVSAPQLLTAVINSFSNVNCYGGNDGTANVLVTGGITPYNYTWSSGQTSASVSNFTAGTYNVTVNDANNCSTSTSVTISQAAQFIASINSFTNVSCNGGNDGDATVTVIGGVAPYTFLWSNGQTQPAAINLTAGIYTVTVDDANNCSTSASVTISEPVLFAVTINSFSSVTCNGGSNGSAAALVNGGIAPYNYVWSNGQTLPTATNLVAGNYFITVSDANSCSASASVVISEPAALGLSISSIDISCNGGNNGSVTTVTSGGTTPYSYLWSGGQTSASITNLTVGSYTITVNDANSCSMTSSVSISEPLVLQVTTNSPVNVNCNGGNSGSDSISVTGGTPTYIYNWNNGQTSSVATNLTAGAYSVTVTDANSCSSSASVSITEPPLLALVTSAVDGICSQANGAAIANVTGGTPAYTYNWSTVPAQTTSTAVNLLPGNYSVTVSDANSCSISASQIVQTTVTNISVNVLSVDDVRCNGESNGKIVSTTSSGTPPYFFSLDSIGFTNSGTFQNLIAGNYTVYVRDSNNCTGSQVVQIVEPPLLTVAMGTLISPSCFGFSDGEVSVIVSGGAAAYQYMWNTVPSQTSATASGLVGGNYTVTVSDANNCSMVQNMSITEPPLLTVTIDPSSFVEILNGNSVRLTAMPSAAVLRYQWSPVKGLDCNNCNSVIASPATTTNYTVVVTNTNNCTAQSSVEVIVNDPHVVFVPNVFTPNNDGNNDFFQIFGTLDQIAFLEILIFNRWGEKVFESGDHHFIWDGKYKGENAPAGIYTYQLKLTYMNGERDELRKGSLSVLR